MSKIKVFLKNEAVLVISALCAAATMLLVPPDSEYLSYIDFRVLCGVSLPGGLCGISFIGCFFRLVLRFIRRQRLLD